MNHALDDRELQTLTVNAAIAAARLRAHDRFCPACSALADPSTASCDRREQLRRLLEGRRALRDARRRALTRP